jgi:superfamily II DNA or RNA helicase
MAIAALGKVIYSVKAKTLIDRGVLAAPLITMVPVKQVASKGSREDGFHGVYDEIISSSEARNDAIINIVRGAPKPCMVFVKIIEHGKLLKKLMEQAGISCEFVWGNTKGPAREAAITRLERGDAEVMIASVVFQEGVDIPSLESVVIGSGGKSVIAALQRIGRGMRTNQGAKTTFQVFDILDMGTPMMERHARRRMNTYVRESYQTTIRHDDGRLLPYEPKLRTRAEKRSLGLV